MRGARVLLRPLGAQDFDQWSEVRTRARDWLVKWEPKNLIGYPDPVTQPAAFESRCSARDREWQLGMGYGFGIFVNDEFAGEINMGNVHRGPLQNASVGYWIDEAKAGRGYVPESLVLMLRFAFEDLNLHRVQIPIVPRNAPSRRVVEKLGIRNEGTAVRYLEINGVWEDHVQYAITSEEWEEHRAAYTATWLTPSAM